MTEVHLVELVIVDHDNMGIEEVKTVLENTRYPNHCFGGMSVRRTRTKEVEWYDNHPLNFTDQRDGAVETLFSEEVRDERR